MQVAPEEHLFQYDSARGLEVSMVVLQGLGLRVLKSSPLPRPRPLPWIINHPPRLMKTAPLYNNGTMLQTFPY